MILIIILVLCVGIYSVFAELLHISPFKISSKFKKEKVVSSNIIDDIMTSLTNQLALYVPLSDVGHIKLSKTLAMAREDKTPKQHMAKLIVIGIFLFILALIGFFIWSYIGVFFLVLIPLFLYAEHNTVLNKAEEYSNDIQKEIPNFISNFTNSIAYNRNVLDILETYKRNYQNTPLSKELAITIADIKTSSTEDALRRMDARINISMLSSLIRGILATLQGENMNIYFQSLVNESRVIWRENLTKQALMIKPKVGKMSGVLAGYAIVAILVVTITLLMDSVGGFL